MLNRLWLLRAFAVLALLVFLAAGFTLYRLQGSPQSQGNGIVLDEPPYMGDITLMTADGGRVAFSDLDASYLLVFFGYTSCPDVCPMTMAVLAEAYRNLGAPDEMQVVMVTVDPATDTPERVQAYAEAFHPDFLGLSGTNTEIAGAASRFYVGFNNVGNNLVAHSDPVAVLDQQRNMRIIYTQDDMKQLESSLRAVLNQQAWQ